MTRRVSLLLVGMLAGILSAGETRLTEQDLRRAEILMEEGDVIGGVTLLFTVLRQSDNGDLRDDARGRLERSGLSRQEIFQLDPGVMKAEEWEKLLSRVSAAAAQRARQEMDLEYAEDLMHLAVAIRCGMAGEIRVDAQGKELARALEIMLRIAVSEGDSDRAREAQSMLERLGIAGARIDAVRKGIADGNLPPDMQNELVCDACLRRLKRYREWLEEGGEEEERLTQRQIARHMGMRIYRHVLKEYPQAAALKQAGELLDFWRGASKEKDPNF